MCLHPLLVCQRTLIAQLLSGGGERVRTDDLLRARQALSQLSYTPAWWAWMELNHRPHAYQACALTRLSYRPFACLPRRLRRLSATFPSQRTDSLDPSKLNSDLRPETGLLRLSLERR